MILEAFQCLLPGGGETRFELHATLGGEGVSVRGGLFLSSRRSELRVEAVRLWLRSVPPGAAEVERSLPAGFTLPAGASCYLPFALAMPGAWSAGETVGGEVEIELGGARRARAIAIAVVLPGDEPLTAVAG